MTLMWLVFGLGAFAAALGWFCMALGARCELQEARWRQEQVSASSPWMRARAEAWRRGPGNG